MFSGLAKTHSGNSHRKDMPVLTLPSIFTIFRLNYTIAPRSQNDLITKFTFHYKVLDFLFVNKSEMLEYIREANFQLI